MPQTPEQKARLNLVQMEGIGASEKEIEKFQRTINFAELKKGIFGALIIDDPKKYQNNWKILLG